MKNEMQKLTQEEITQLFCAANERNITAGSLTEEIQPVLEEYFIGKFLRKEEGLEITFLNGQKFNLSVTTI